MNLFDFIWELLKKEDCSYWKNKNVKLIHALEYAREGRQVVIDKNKIITKDNDFLMEDNKQKESDILDLSQTNIEQQGEIEDLEIDFQDYKEHNNIYEKPVPILIRKATKNTDYVYRATVYMKLFSGHNIKWKTDKPRYNHFSSINGAVLQILINAGLLKLDGTVIENTNAVDVFSKITTAVQRYYTYTYDKNLGFFADLWFGSAFSMALKMSDCEDINQTIVDAFTTYEFLTLPFINYSVFNGLGYYIDKNGNNFGHSFAILLPATSVNIEDIYIGEATSRVGNPKTIKQLQDNGVTYTCDWGVIGIMNKSNVFGGYVVKQDLRWWINTAGRKLDGTIDRLKRIVSKPKIDSSDENQDAIKNGWKQ